MVVSGELRVASCELPGGGGGGPVVSVVVCTYRPRGDLFLEVMRGLARQTIGAGRFEVVVVDNGSEPAVEAPETEPRLHVRVVREERVGLNFARRAGIRAARAGLLVFVDDDNILDADYLEVAARVAGERGEVGAFGGIARGRLEAENLPGWKLRLVDKLGVRDCGEKELVSKEDKWGPWEPIGAGMVLRRVVAEKFVEVMETVPEAGRLDRSGPSGLMSGGDTLMARCAYRVGLACGYFPSLRLTHVIKAGRFEFKYLVRILYAHGRSVVLLDRVLGRPVRRMGVVELVLRAGYRVVTRGVPGCIIYAWDLGCFAEGRRVN